MKFPMRTASLEVRDRGQVTLPKALRDALQLKVCVPFISGIRGARRDR